MIVKHVDNLNTITDGRTILKRVGSLFFPDEQHARIITCVSPVIDVLLGWGKRIFGGNESNILERWT